MECHGSEKTLWVSYKGYALWRDSDDRMTLYIGAQFHASIIHIGQKIQPVFHYHFLIIVDTTP
jgi:hypothetical protein